MVCEEGAGLMFTDSEVDFFVNEAKKKQREEFLEDLKDIIAMDSYWRPIHDKANEKYKKWEAKE